MRRRWETTNNQVPWRQLGDKAFLMAQWVENLPAMQETQETQLRSLGQEDSLEEEMATHSSILAWKIPWREEPEGLLPRVSQSRTPLKQFSMHPHTRTLLIKR